MSYLIIKNQIQYYPAEGKQFMSYPDSLTTLSAPRLNNSETIDKALHDFIFKNLDKLKDAKILFVPLALGQDYANFTGLRLGLHIRLTQELEIGRFMPIIFMGEESYEEIARLSPLSSFLFTKGVALIKEMNNEILAAQEYWERKSISVDYLNDTFLKRLNIPKPDFYDSKHNLLNELSLLYLDQLSGHDTLKNQKELQLAQSSLYVKWTLAKRRLPLPQSSAHPIKFEITESKGKRILLLDDDSNKGWGDLLGAFFCNAQIFHTLPIEKNDKIENLKEKLGCLLKEKEWDLFLLDIRLLDIDHTDNKPLPNLSGFELLKLIKSHNFGNQVILFSASSRYLTYLEGIEMGADEVWIKPHERYERDVLTEFREAASRCFDRLFFKALYTNLENLNKEMNSASLKTNNQDYNDLMSEVWTLLKMAVEALRLNNEYSKQYFLILLFKTIEVISNYYVINPSNKYKPMLFRDGAKVPNYRYDEHAKKFTEQEKNYPSTLNKFASVCLDRWQIEAVFNDYAETLYNITTTRNKVIHERKNRIKLNIDHLVLWHTNLIIVLCHHFRNIGSSRYTLPR